MDEKTRISLTVDAIFVLSLFGAGWFCMVVF
jgi:hypothetical protein